MEVIFFGFGCGFNFVFNLLEFLCYICDEFFDMLEKMFKGEIVVLEEKI